MRHRNGLRKLNRTSSHRQAMLRNLAASLFEHGQVVTTIPKAKAVQPFVGSGNLRFGRACAD